MIDRLLGIGATFDWISPLYAWGMDVANGPSHTFLLSEGGADVERLLRRRGIKTWGLMLVGDTLMITVPLAQAQQAAQVLERAGLSPNVPAPPRGERGGRGGAPARASDDWFSEAVANYLGE